MNSVPQFGTCSHMPFHVFCVLNYIMPYFVRLCLQHVIIFHYVHNIILNVMTTNNENNYIIKSLILCHIKQHNNTRSTCQQQTILFMNKPQDQQVIETTECNEATFPFSGHRDSPPSLLSLGVHAQVSSPSPPCTQQHASFPPLPCAPFFSLLSVSLLHHLLVLCLPPQQFLHPFLVFRLNLSVDPLLKITERWRGLQKMQLLQNKKIMQDVI